MTPPNPLAARLALICRALGWSERELGRRAGLRSESHVNLIRSGKSATIATLVALADGANVSLAWLATGRGRPLDDELRLLLFRCVNCQFFLAAPERGTPAPASTPTAENTDAVFAALEGRVAEAAAVQAVWDLLNELPRWAFLADDARLPAAQRIAQAIPRVRARIQENAEHALAIEKQA